MISAKSFSFLVSNSGTYRDYLCYFLLFKFSSKRTNTKGSKIIIFKLWVRMNWTFKLNTTNCTLFLPFDVIEEMSKDDEKAQFMRVIINYIWW